MGGGVGGWGKLCSAVVMVIAVLTTPCAAVSCGAGGGGKGATAFDCLMAQLRHKRPKARFLPHLLCGAVIVDSRPAYSLVIDAVFVVAV